MGFFLIINGICLKETKRLNVMQKNNNIADHVISIFNKFRPIVNLYQCSMSLVQSLWKPKWLKKNTCKVYVEIYDDGKPNTN